MTANRKKRRKEKNDKPTMTDIFRGSISGAFFLLARTNSVHWMIYELFENTIYWLNALSVESSKFNFNKKHTNISFRFPENSFPNI